MLPSEKNTPSMEKKVLVAARKYFHKRRGITAFYEHGHWWVDVETPEDTIAYDVVDAEGGDSINGFSFESVI